MFLNPVQPSVLLILITFLCSAVLAAAGVSWAGGGILRWAIGQISRAQALLAKLAKNVHEIKREHIEAELADGEAERAAERRRESG